MFKTLVGSFLANPDHAIVEGQDPEEKTLYVIRKSFITNFSWLIASILLVLAPFFLLPLLAHLGGSFVLTLRFQFALVLFWYLFTFGYAFQNFLLWFFNTYIITTKRIIDTDFQGLLYKNISETPITNIEDVTSNVTGAFGTIFNIGDVLIQTAAEKDEFEFEQVADPSKVRDIISDMLTNLKRNAE